MDQPRRVSDKGTDEVKVGREQAQVGTGRHGVEGEPLLDH